jgi:CxxC-x17-CxxC domain-containing protein
MAYFKSPKDYGRARDDRGGDRGGDRGDREMFTATCANCNKSCEVPFRPNGQKPVYCKDCFGTMKGADERGGDRGGSDRGGFAPRGDSRPSYNAPRAEAAAPSASNAQMEKLTAKVDALAKSLDYLVTLVKGSGVSASTPVARTEPKTVAPVIIAIGAKKVSPRKAPAAKKVAKKGKK